MGILRGAIMEHDEKKMSKSDYEAYLSLALSSADHEWVNSALEETVYAEDGRQFE